MANKENTPKGKATVAELLRQDDLPFFVRDYLRKFADGETLPYADRFDFDQSYHDTELLVAVLADEHATNDPISSAAKDFVESMLFRMGEAFGIRDYKTPDIARVFYPVIMQLSAETAPYAGSDETPTIAIRAGLEKLCTKRELSEFYDRHNLKTEERAEPEEWGNVTAGVRLAALLADPHTPADVRGNLEHALIEFSNSTNIHLSHPAIIERAFVVMTESMATPFKGKGAKVKNADRKRDYKQVIALLDEVTEPKGGES